mmetsp:Transcript_59169/g.101914  ORF Transcript_59169/g.101914 Transcript_59169/m.101914 type:complete len:222 (+) Transcript_59169:277-942(+)
MVESLCCRWDMALDKSSPSSKPTPSLNRYRSCVATDTCACTRNSSRAQHCASNPAQHSFTSSPSRSTSSLKSPRASSAAASNAFNFSWYSPYSVCCSSVMPLTATSSTLRDGEFCPCATPCATTTRAAWSISAIHSGMGSILASSAPSFLVSSVPCIMSISARSPMLSFRASASAFAFALAAADLSALTCSVSYGKHCMALSSTSRKLAGSSALALNGLNV